MLAEYKGFSICFTDRMYKINLKKMQEQALRQIKGLIKRLAIAFLFQKDTKKVLRIVPVSLPSLLMVSRRR